MHLVDTMEMTESSVYNKQFTWLKITKYMVYTNYKLIVYITKTKTKLGTKQQQVR